MNLEKISSLLALVAAFSLCTGMQPVLAQVAPSATAQQFTIHEDLLKCFQNLGKTADQEKEYLWLLNARPSNALYHYNYACLLKSSTRYPAASVQYEKAAMNEGSNADYVGQCGQMFFYLKNYQKAYQYLGKAMQMPGGDKYKSSFDACRDYLQAQAQARAVAAQTGPKGSSSSSGPAGSKRPKDDDDD